MTLPSPLSLVDTVTSVVLTLFFCWCDFCRNIAAIFSGSYDHVEVQPPSLLVLLVECSYGEKEKSCFFFLSPPSSLSLVMVCCGRC